MAIIGIDIGHGTNTFPPDKGVYKNGQAYPEHTFNSKVGQRLKEILEGNGHSIILGQQPFQKDVPLQTRTNLYDNKNVDLIVSIHADANNNKNAKGRYYFYWHDSKKGKKLAQSIRDEIKAKGYSLRGNGLQPSRVGDWTNLHITRVPKVPSILGENGFMTNDQDFNLIFGSQQDQYVEDIAEAYANGIIKYLGGTPKKVTKSKKSNNNLASVRLVKNENGYFLATENIKVRNKPSTEATHTGTLPKGSSINYFKVYEGNGYRWLQYTGYSGNTLYVPYRPSNDINDQWGTFHSQRP